MDRIITRWKSAIQYSFSAVVAGDQIRGAFQLHSVAKERLKEWQHQGDDNQLLLNQTKHILSSISNQCTKETSDLWPLDLNNNNNNDTRTTTTTTTTTTSINQKVVYITLDDALASFQSLFSNIISTNDNNSGDPSSGIQRVSALRYKWVDNNNTNNNTSSSSVADNDDNTSINNNNNTFYPTLDMESGTTQQLYT